jgi:hypothetical protein
MSSEAQLAALDDVARGFEGDGLDYWLFGGWGRDFHAGRETRPHGDVDLAVWLTDRPRMEELLLAAGWRHAPEPDEDGGTGFERAGVRLELTFLVRDGDGRACIQFDAGPAPWAEKLGDDVRELRGVRARVLPLECG